MDAEPSARDGDHTMDGAKPQDLSVRQHERLACDLGARVTISPGHGVRLSRLAPGGGGEFDVRVVDVSRGGLGLRSAVYLPPACVLTVRLLGEGGAPAFECLGTVRRASMIDRSPAYYVGVSTEARSPEQERAIAQTMDVLRVALSQEKRSA